MVPFAGFEMPVQYRSGVLAEHAAVREKVGLFDITHMGEILVTGTGAEACLDGLATNKVAGLAAGKVVYTAMCREDGGVLDDMLIYRLATDRWLVVCNAINRAKMMDWMRKQLVDSDVTLADVSDETALIAVQGPAALTLLQRAGVLERHAEAIAELKFYSNLALAGSGGEWIISRTGYTGERGYEIYAPNATALPLWEELLARGEDLEVTPVGLAARDTLRFEMGYCLYGHELSEEISPLEAGIGWAVKFKKDSYIGKDALQLQKEAGVPRRLIGLRVEGRAIARQGAEVLAAAGPIGQVTSGSYGPTLKQSLALALVTTPLPSEDLTVAIRDRSFPCRQVPLPFLPARVKGDPHAARTLTG